MSANCNYIAMSTCIHRFFCIFLSIDLYSNYAYLREQNCKHLRFQKYVSHIERISSSCSSSRVPRVILVNYKMTNHERGKKDGGVTDYDKRKISEIL